MPFVRIPSQVGPFKKWANKVVDASDVRPDKAGGNKRSGRKRKKPRRRRRLTRRIRRRDEKET